MSTYVADFETTTRMDDCRVWAYGLCDIDKIQDIKYGTSIDEFMSWCEHQPDNPKVLFHNLKFDGQFILYWLLSNGFRCVDKNDRASRTFTTIINNKGMYYAIEVIFSLKGKRVKKVVFQDSLKLIPLKVEQIAESFHLPYKKLEIDYTAHDNQPIGSPITEKEKQYIAHDVKIVATAVSFFYSMGYDKITLGSCALNDYISLVSKKIFKRFFPIPGYHEDVKQSYRGGFTYVNPAIQGKLCGAGLVLDVNSLYPYCMYNEALPYGNPIFFKGKYKPDKIFNLYVQMIRCQFELKPGKLPTVQVKGSIFFRSNEYLVSSHDEIVPLCLTSVDLELFFENYDVYNLEYMSGWKFKSAHGMFDSYIEKWTEIKKSATESGDWGMRTVAKLFMNVLYGKFGQDTMIRLKIPYMDEEEKKVKMKTTDIEERDGIYIALSSFITSYARDKIIRAAQRVCDDYNAGRSKIQFAYCDTDSLHLLTDDFSIPEWINVDQTKIGKFKIESKFRAAKYLRQKCYIEDSTTDIESTDPEYKLKVTVSGMPSSCHDQINFKNFKYGAVFKGKLTPKIVEGGAVLQEIEFSLKK